MQQLRRVNALQCRIFLMFNSRNYPSAIVLTNRFKSILVALDGSADSRRGMNEAISLARQTEATITGIHVIPGLPQEAANGYKKYLLDKAKTFMSDAKKNAALHGIDFAEKVITSNDIANTIVNFADSNKFDIVIIGARGQSSPKSEYFGSVSNGVLHSSRVPLLVVKFGRG